MVLGEEHGLTLSADAPSSLAVVSADAAVQRTRLRVATPARRSAGTGTPAPTSGGASTRTTEHSETANRASALRAREVVGAATARSHTRRASVTPGRTPSTADATTRGDAGSAAGTRNTDSAVSRAATGGAASAFSHADNAAASAVGTHRACATPSPSTGSAPRRAVAPQSIGQERDDDCESAGHTDLKGTRRQFISTSSPVRRPSCYGDATTLTISASSEIAAGTSRRWRR